MDCPLCLVFLYRAPENDSTEYSGQFILERVYSDFADNTTFIDWSSDSRRVHLYIFYVMTYA